VCWGGIITSALVCLRSFFPHPGDEFRLGADEPEPETEAVGTETWEHETRIRMIRKHTKYFEGVSGINVRSLRRAVTRVPRCEM
jgi:hypothetical protein